MSLWELCAAAVVDGDRQTRLAENQPQLKPLPHRQEVDPLYLSACHLQWENNDEASAGWELIGGSQLIKITQSFWMVG